MDGDGTFDWRDLDGLVPAAVVVPVIGTGPSRRLLFTRRAPDLDTHPGQMSFPGGRAEAVDGSPLATALRETEEEIGVSPDAVEVVGQLEPIETVTGFHVEAFIGQIPPGPFALQHSEVAEVVTLPVAALLDHTHYERERREHPTRGDVTVHYFSVDDHTVWGATARLLVQYLAETAGWSPPSD